MELYKIMKKFKYLVGLICVVIFFQLVTISVHLGTVYNPGILTKSYKDSTSHEEHGSKISSSLEPSIDITVVTAFFDIGSFSKGPSHRRDVHTYYTWMEIFRYIKNNVVFFADTDEAIRRFTKIRQSSLERTKIIKVNRSNAWPFQNLKQIENVFRSNSFSNFTSFYPIYTCVTHAKYYVMEIAATKDYFHTQYIMWLDIGYFRRRKSKKPFYLSTPEGFNTSEIAVTQVFHNKTFNVIPRIIFASRDTLISGALFLGQRSQILKYVTQFKRAVDYFLKFNLTNTDEQIIYAMYSKKASAVLKPEVKPHLYPAKKEKDWLYIGYTMVKE